MSLGIGIFLSLCDLAVLYIFNYQLLASNTTSSVPIEQQEKDNYSNMFLYIVGCIACIIGSKVGSFIVHYTGTLLLGAALGLPSTLTLTVAVLVATVTTISGLLLSSMQAYDLWQTLFSASVTKNSSEVLQPSTLNLEVTISPISRVLSKTQSEEILLDPISSPIFVKQHSQEDYCGNIRFFPEQLPMLPGTDLSIGEDLLILNPRP